MDSLDLSKFSAVARVSHQRAVQNAEKLKAVWAKRGYVVATTIEPVHAIGPTGDTTSRVIGFTVRSDMVGGFPKDYPRPGVCVVKRRPPPEGGLFHY